MAQRFKVSSLALMFLGFLAASISAAQDVATYSVETDPSTFVLKGYAVHLRVKPAGENRLVFGVGTYALQLPPLMVDLNGKNRDKGWTVNMSSAYALFGEYYFDELSNKWFAALQVGAQNYRNTNAYSGGAECSYTNLLVMPSVGYTWKPFAVPMYFKPWFGVGYTRKISGSNTVSGSEYDISPLVPFATLHVGYTFH